MDVYGADCIGSRSRRDFESNRASVRDRSVSRLVTDILGEFEVGLGERRRGGVVVGGGRWKKNENSQSWAIFLLSST